MKPRRFLLAAALFIAGLSAQAQDTIQFTWNATAWEQIAFGIIATADEQFSIEWGDGNTYQMIGTDASQVIAYFYYSESKEYMVTITSNTPDCFFTQLGVARIPALGLYYSFNTVDVSKCPSLKSLNIDHSNLTTLDVTANTALQSLACHYNQLTSLDLSKNTALTYLNCSSNQLTSLDLSKNTALQNLVCNDNQLTSLDISKNTALTSLSCYNNRFQLSDLYNFSKKTSLLVKSLGTQRLDSQTIKINELVDFSSQAIFDGIETIFTIEKNGTLALLSNYDINNGIITFYDTGDYTITMTNTAIVSHTFPAKVIAEINVSKRDSVSIAENPLRITNYELRITNYELRITNCELPIENIQIFDVLGRKQKSEIRNQKSEIRIDISHLEKGMYFVRINETVRKFIKY